MDNNTALIVLDTEIVASTKIDQANWLLNKADGELETLISRYAMLQVSCMEDVVKADEAIMDIKKYRRQWDTGRKDWGSVFDLAKKTMDRCTRERDEPASELQEGIVSRRQSFLDALERQKREREAAARKIAEEAQAALVAKQQADEKVAREAAEAEGKKFVAPPPTSIPEIIVAPEPEIVIPKAEGAKYRRYWRSRVDNLAEVPDAFIKRVLNDEAVDNHIKNSTTKKAGQMSECTASIPGITIYYEDRPA